MPSLEDEIRAAGGPLQLMRSGRSAAFPFPIRAEFTNWRDEQESRLIWGEPNGGSANPAVERHTQTVIRATITQRPFPVEGR
ncbi:hypothetical protein Acsp03_35800 [Actinomadura sp. NBRC 104412]|uniref:hypothetical protein n=1 Tax=Actinomadura sp. NBRC 104412 TaxID=3032203 RepID=UPI00249FB45E|nr:hypothetical protein [Actinomadura sp. NBRC 104412]GLZ06114.1 hypothetical protein Acsp03_35800 [Actinomadura sp. NBRC 104412]